MKGVHFLQNQKNQGKNHFIIHLAKRSHINKVRQSPEKLNLMKVLILQVSLCSTVEQFATFALLRFKEYLHQFRFAQFANKALSNTYFAILALLELCKIICFPSLCSGTKYISTARSSCCANKASFRFNFYRPANFVYMLPFTTRWIKKYIVQASVNYPSQSTTL